MSPTRLAELLQRLEGGEMFSYLFFWGNEPAEAGVVDQSCFSQWFDAPFAIDGITYPTAEHWMMAEKARLFGDEAILAKILASRHPYAAKRLGRQVANFDAERWSAAAFDLVVRGNLAKFSQHPALGAYLLATGEAVIVEASPDDRIWGVGLTETDPTIEVPALWQGENLLGFALMVTRQALRTR